MGSLYVPDKAYLVCTDGMRMQQIIVSSQHSIKITGGRLGATIDDRTGGNFICAKMVVAGAVAGAILAIVVVATAPVSLGIGAAMAIGAAAGAATGGLLASMPCTCALLTMPHDWVPVHPRVKFESKKALIDKSIVPCILGGKVLIHYSKEAAEAAVDLKRKETAYKVAFIIAASYLAGPAVEGGLAAGSTFMSILNGIGWRAAASYAGSLSMGIATNFGIDRAKDEVKDGIYTYTGIKQYTEAPNTNIDAIQEQQSLREEKKEEDGGLFDPYDDSKRLGESAAASHKQIGDRVGNYETIDYESRTVYTSNGSSIEEYQSDRVTNSAPGAIQGHTPTVNTVSGQTTSSSSSESLLRNETYRQETGREYRPLTASESSDVRRNIRSSWTSDYFSKPKIEKHGIGGGGLIMDLVQDLYKGVTNTLLRGEIKDYVEALKTAEQVARAGVNVRERQI
jgi:hypothetical protein